MKFGDKLISLRKKQGLSQEELAEKLKVSRQSVSKWESNNTYPETDKIIQICNIFNCNMDDLINDKITDIDQLERVSKSKLNIDSFLEFLTKTINVFSNMSFSSCLKCLVELFILGLILFLVGGFIYSILDYILLKAFSFINYKNGLRNLLEAILILIWLVFSIIILIYYFKVKYLDEFEQLSINKEKETTKKLNNTKPLKEEKNKIKVNFKHEPFAFLSILSKIGLLAIKFITTLIICSFICILFIFLVIFIILIPLCLDATLILGINISLFSTIIFIGVLTLAMLFFIFNKKISFKVTLITTTTSFLFIALGVAITILCLKDMTFKSNKDEYIEKQMYKKELTYNDKMFFEFNDSYYPDINYIIDNSLETNKILLSAEYDKALLKLNLNNSIESDLVNYTLNFDSNYQFKDIYEDFSKNLRNKVVKNYSYIPISNIKIRANEETINKLLANYSKLYLANINKTSTGYKVKYIDDKIEINGWCDVEYYVNANKLEIYNSDCMCKKETMDTRYGQKIVFNCQEMDV